MSTPKTRIAAVAAFLSKHILWVLLASYAIAAVWPGFGLRIRDITFGHVTLFGDSMKVTLPTVMLGLLLFNAGMGVKISELRGLAGRPSLLLGGLGANLAIPIAYIYLVSQAMSLWHNPDEVQNILVGLALVASMPIAGSSTAWAQNAEGDLALSLGLVVLSTFLSPLTTPLALHSVAVIATGSYARDLNALAAHGTGAFLGACVIAPSLLGIAARQLIGERRYGIAKPWLKVSNSVNLVLLCYSNAAISLPQAVAHPDADFLVAILVITVGLCATTFGAGWLLGRLAKADASKRASLMYGLGMNNNGTGLVLASMALAGHPRVLLPIIFYNLVQQVVAGIVGSYAASAARAEETSPRAVNVATLLGRTRDRLLARRPTRLALAGEASETAGSIGHSEPSRDLR